MADAVTEPAEGAIEPTGEEPVFAKDPMEDIEALLLGSN
jgi:hypothetical protein